MSELVKPQRGTSWTGILIGMEVGDKLPAALEHRNTVAPLISRHLKLSHPGMKWATRKQDQEIFNIIRTQ